MQSFQNDVYPCEVKEKKKNTFREKASAIYNQVLLNKSLVISVSKSFNYLEMYLLGLITCPWLLNWKFN